MNSFSLYYLNLGWTHVELSFFIEFVARVLEREDVINHARWRVGVGAAEIVISVG